MSAIYALVDPRDGEVRYIGKTQRAPRDRLLDHVRNASKPSSKQRRLSCWIRSLPKVPHLIVLDADPDDLNQAERDWIWTFRLLEARLCNMTDGGDGQPLGYKPSADTIAKLASFRHTPESRAKISKAMRGRRPSTETRRRLSVAATGRPGTMTGRKMPADAVARTVAAHRGSKRTIDARANIARAKLAVHISDEDVRAIRGSAATHSEIATRYGVSRSTVWRIRSGRSWGWVSC